MLDYAIVMLTLLVGWMEDDHYRWQQFMDVYNGDRPTPLTRMELEAEDPDTDWYGED